MTKENKSQKDTEKLFEDLEDLKNYIEEVMDFLPTAICFVNPLDFILETNNFFEKITGYDKIESVGLRVEDLFLEKEEIRNFVDELKEKKEKISQEFTLISKDIKPIFVSLSATVRKDEKGYFVGYFLSIVDMTEKRALEKKISKELNKKTEELFEKSKQMGDSRSALLNILEDVDKSYKEAEKEKTKTIAIIENFIDGMFFFGGDNKLSIINPKGEEFFKIKGKDIVNKKIEELEKLPELKDFIYFIKDNNGGIKKLFRAELKINEDLYLEVTATKVKESESELGTLIHMHDITREKRIEKIKSEFVSVAAHQLRTPLSGIKWTLETFLEEVAEEKNKLDDDEVLLIKKAYDANERMVVLVNDLLNVSRMEEGRYLYEPKIIDIFEILNPIINNYQEIVKNEKKEIQLKIRKKQGFFPKVKIDIEKIGIVIENFLDNAIKYTDKGLIILSIEMIEKDLIKISVKDEGVGIPKEQQERLFNKFFRAENVVRKDVEGSGLGLFISKNIIEAHGGEISFNSEEGVGSSFYFTLPTVKDNKTEFLKGF